MYYIYGSPYCQGVCAWPINGPWAVDLARSTALLRTGLPPGSMVCRGAPQGFMRSTGFPSEANVYLGIW